MGILTNRLFLDDDYSTLGPGQSTLSSMMSGLESGAMGRSTSAGLGSSSEVVGQVPVEGVSGGGSPLQMIGEQLGLSPERMEELLAYKGSGYQTQKGNFGLQGTAGNYVRSLGHEGGSREELARGPVSSGRDGGPSSAAEWDAQQQGMGRDAAGFSMVDVQKAAQADKGRDASNNKFFKDVGRKGSEDVLFYNLSKIPEEQLGKIDFSDEDVMMNLSNPNFESRVAMHSRGGKDGVMDALTESNKASGMGVYGAAILPKVISTGIGLINPIAGAAANAFIGGGTTGDWTGSLKNAGIGLATSIAGAAIGGGWDGMQAGTGIGEGALSGVTDSMSSAGLRGMTQMANPSGASDMWAYQSGLNNFGTAQIPANLTGEAVDQWAYQSGVDNFGNPQPSTAGANLAKAQADAKKDMAKKFGAGLFQSAIGPLSSLFQSKQQSAGGDGAFIGNEGAFESIFGIKESGMGFLDPISEQQISGIGVK